MLATRPRPSTSFRAIRMPNTYPQLKPARTRKMTALGKIFVGSMRLRPPAKAQNKPMTVYVARWSASGSGRVTNLLKVILKNMDTGHLHTDTLRYVYQDY